MNELKVTIAENITRLRTAAGMKQSDLAEKICYSDKSVSKWERAVSMPDVAVLKSIADTFGVTMDYMVTEHKDEDEDGFESLVGQHTVSHSMIIAVALAGIWAVALCLFIAFWLKNAVYVNILFAAVPISLATLIVLNSIWFKGKNNFFYASALMISIIALIYLLFIKHNWWQIFLIVVPLEFIILCSFHIIKPRKK